MRTMKRGRSAVRSHPALIEFADMFVPSYHIAGSHLDRMYAKNEI